MSGPTQAGERGRKRDQYGRPLYSPSEVPPAEAGFAMWQGGVCAPDPGCAGRTHVPSEHNHARMCKGGWIRSLDWWLHCGRCRPIQEPSLFDSSGEVS